MRRIPTAGWLPTLGLLACAGPATVDDADPDVPEPTPYIVEDDEGEEVEVELDAVAADLQRTLDTLWQVNAGPVLDAYAAVEADQTETCPRTYVNAGNEYWFDTCTTTDGTSFSGYGFFYDYVDYPINEQFTGRMTVLNGAARVDTADGYALDIAGTAQLIEAAHVSQPAFVWRSDLRGTFDWDGPEAEGTWLETDLAPDFSIQAYHREDLAGSMISLEGGLSGTGTASAYVFDGVSVIDRSLGGMCPQEGSGTVSVRTDEGVWVDILFDGPDPQTFEGDPAECDGIGRAFYRGQELGPVEVDFSTLFFQGAPW